MELQPVKGEEVVFCPPEESSPVYTANRGADGTIIDRQTSKKGKRVRVKSFLVRWRLHRKGVASFRIKGKKRAKSDWYTAVFNAKSRDSVQWRTAQQHSRTNDIIPRFEEEVKDLHPIAYCRDCPLRLRRMVAPCNMSKDRAIEKYGEVE
jgi:hypothetical protein